MAKPSELLDVFAVLEGGTTKKPPQAALKEWPRLLAKYDAKLLLAAAQALVMDHERRASGWPSLPELLRFYREKQADRDGRADEAEDTLTHLARLGKRVHAQGTGPLYNKPKIYLN